MLHTEKGVSLYQESSERECDQQINFPALYTNYSLSIPAFWSLFTFWTCCPEHGMCRRKTLPELESLKFTSAEQDTTQSNSAQFFCMFCVSKRRNKTETHQNLCLNIHRGKQEIGECCYTFHLTCSASHVVCKRCFQQILLTDFVSYKVLISNILTSHLKHSVMFVFIVWVDWRSQVQKPAWGYVSPSTRDLIEVKTQTNM